MDFDKLNAFYHVANTESVTRASEILQIGKSSISRQISLLEDHLDVHLFERQGKQMVLTPSGRFLYTKARAILFEVEATKTALSEHSDKVSGNLTITADHGLIGQWLTTFIPKFIEAHPDLQLKLIANNQKLDISLKEADVAVGFVPPEGDWVIKEHLKTCHYKLYASKKYLEKFGTPKKIKDLDGHRIIAIDTYPFFPQGFTDWPLRRGSLPPRKPFVVINNILGRSNLVRAGVGIASFNVDSQFAKEKDIVPILPKEMHHHEELYYIYPKQSRHNPNISAFGDFLHKNCKKQSVRKIAT